MRATLIAATTLLIGVHAAIAEPAAEVKKIETDRPVYCAAFSPDGKFLITGSQGKVAHLWDVDAGKKVRTFEGYHTPVWSVAFSSDGKQVLTGSGGHDPDAIPIPGLPPPPYDNLVRIFDVESGKEVRKFEGHTDRVVAVAFAGDHVVSGSVDRTVRVWDVKTGKEVSKFKVEDTHQVFTLTLSPDGKRALMAHTARIVKLFDVVTGKELLKFENGNGIVWKVAFSPDGKQAATAAGYHRNPKDGKITYFDTTVRLWDLESGKLLRTLEGHETIVMTVAFTPDGRRIISGSGAPYFSRPRGAIKEVVTDNSIRVWDAASGKELQKYTGHTEIVYGLAVSPKDGIFASTSEDKSIRIWQLPK